jgi:hypothetical protein
MKPGDEKPVSRSVKDALKALESDDLQTARRVITTEIKPKVARLTWHEASAVAELLGILGAMRIIIAEKVAHPKKTKAWLASLKAKQKSQVSRAMGQMALGG